MSEAVLFDALKHGLWISVVISAPILTAALLAGVSIGLFQALTSIQEMTLTFVPKLAAIIAVFWLSMSFMTDALVAFFQGSLIPLVVGG